MSNYSKNVEKLLQSKFKNLFSEKPGNKPIEKEETKDPYAEMSNEELNDVYNNVNKDEAVLTAIKNDDDSKELENLEEYFDTEEQVDLVSKGIKLTTAKKYKIDTGKHPLGNKKSKNPTNIFKKWLKTNFPTELNFLKETKEIEEAIEENNNNDKKEDLKEKTTEPKQTLKVHDIQQKIRDYQEKKEEKPTEPKQSNKGISLFEKDSKKEIIPDKKDPLSIKKPKEEIVIIEKPKTELIIQEEQESLPIQKFDATLFPSETAIRFLINRHKFVKDNLLDKYDIIIIKGNKFVKKSGWRKFINAFGISIELIEQKVYEQFNDKHAEIRVRAVAPNGQSVEGIGIKSWSELYEKTMHNLISTAWTRAVNRAVSDLVGYGAVSYEELSEQKGADLF